MSTYTERIRKAFFIFLQIGVFDRCSSWTPETQRDIAELYVSAWLLGRVGTVGKVFGMADDVKAGEDQLGSVWCRSAEVKSQNVPALVTVAGYKCRLLGVALLGILVVIYLLLVRI